MIPLPWSLIGKAGILVAIVAIIFFGSRIIEGRINDYVETKEALVETRINEARQAALIEYQQKLAVVEAEYRSKHVELIESTNAEMTRAREEANKIRLDASQMTRIAQSERGNEALSYRAAQATRKLYNEIEALSDWSTVYQ